MHRDDAIALRRDYAIPPLLFQLPLVLALSAGHPAGVVSTGQFVIVFGLTPSPVPSPSAVKQSIGRRCPGLASPMPKTSEER
jgi:hypothetical protein